MVGSSIVLGGLAERIPNAHWLTPLALIVGLVIAFYPIYHVFADSDVGVRDVLPGVVVAAVGWAALQGLFQLYLAVADPTLGSLFGGVIVVVTYLYFSALVFLLGAVVNAVFGDHSTGRPAAIGRQRNGYVTERVESFDSDELDAYLGDLRTELTTADGDVRVEFLDGRLEPDGTVDIFEQSRSSDSGGEWTVTLRWTFIDEQSRTVRMSN